MEQHPVPQNISSYEFRLVGDMTLKQFFQLAGGIIVGLVIFRLPLPGIIKYPFVFLAVLAGILMAFVPINGRPFTQYIVAFIRAIYSPTEFTWSPDPPSPLPVPATPALVSSPSLSPASVSTPPSQSLSQISVPAPSAPVPIPPSPSPSPSLPPASVSSTPKPSPPPALSPSSISTPVPPSPAPTPPPSPPAPSQTSISVPPAPVLTPPLASPVAQTTTTISAPSRPNIVVGQVNTSQNQSVDGAIIEITDSVTGMPVRALRTNRLGQFQIATPLTSGRYTLVVEKDGLSFQPVSITVSDSIIPPIIISAQVA